MTEPCNLNALKYSITGCDLLSRKYLIQEWFMIDLIIEWLAEIYDKINVALVMAMWKSSINTSMVLYVVVGFDKIFFL